MHVCGYPKNMGLEFQWLTFCLWLQPFVSWRQGYIGIAWGSFVLFWLCVSLLGCFILPRIGRTHTILAPLITILLELPVVGCAVLWCFMPPISVLCASLMLVMQWWVEKHYKRVVLHLTWELANFWPKPNSVCHGTANPWPKTVILMSRTAKLLLKTDELRPKTV